MSVCNMERFQRGNRLQAIPFETETNSYDGRQAYWREHPVQWKQAAPVEIQAETGHGLQYETLVDISFFASLIHYIAL